MPGILESGATSHMCNTNEFFVEYHAFQNPGEVPVMMVMSWRLVCHSHRSKS